MADEDMEILRIENQHLRAALSALLDASQMYSYTAEDNVLRLAAAERAAQTVLGALAPGPEATEEAIHDA